MARCNARSEAILHPCRHAVCPPHPRCVPSLTAHQVPVLRILDAAPQGHLGPRRYAIRDVRTVLQADPSRSQRLRPGPVARRTRRNSARRASVRVPALPRGPAHLPRAAGASSPFRFLHTGRSSLGVQFAYNEISFMLVRLLQRRDRARAQVPRAGVPVADDRAVQVGGDQPRAARRQGQGGHALQSRCGPDAGPGCSPRACAGKMGG